MKSINIAIFQQYLRIYKADERAKFERKYGEMPDDWYGCHNGDAIFIGDNTSVDMIGTCYHESVHFVDWLLEHRLGVTLESLWDHTELRAYMVQWVGDQVRRYCCE